MSEARQFAIHVVDLLHHFVPCEVRRMFGGFGIYHQGLMFGLIADGSRYLKADDQSRERFEAEGSEAFFEDEQACLNRARTAFDAALRNPK